MLILQMKRQLFNRSMFAVDFKSIQSPECLTFGDVASIDVSRNFIILVFCSILTFGYVFVKVLYSLNRMHNFHIKEKKERKKMSVCLSNSVYLPLPLYIIFLTVPLPVCVSVCMFDFFFTQYLILSFPSVYLFISFLLSHLFHCLFLFACLSTCLSVALPLCLSTLSVPLYVCLQTLSLFLIY